MTEAIYQSLVVSLDENAPESVHLTMWPEYDASAVNEELEKKWI